MSNLKLQVRSTLFYKSESWTKLKKLTFTKSDVIWKVSRTREGEGHYVTKATLSLEEPELDSTLSKLLSYEVSE